MNPLIKKTLSLLTLSVGTVLAGCTPLGDASELELAEARQPITDSPPVWQIVSRSDTRPSGRMAEFSSYEINLVNVEPYLEGHMVPNDDPPPPARMALSFLPASEDNIFSNVQLFTGFYPSAPVDGSYRRSDWLYWTTQPDIRILTRSSFRRKNHGKDVGWGLVGGNMDFNIGGHGGGYPSSRVCFGPLNMVNGAVAPCTTATDPNDATSPSHPVAQRHMYIPVYDYQEAPDFWSFITRDFPSTKTSNETEYLARKTRYLAHLPAAVAGGVRQNAGFVFNTGTDNGFNGFSTWILPPNSNSCGQSAPGKHYIRSRVWAVDNVPYRDDSRGGRGDIVPSGTKIRVMFFATEHLPADGAPSNYFQTKLVNLGGTDRTEVYMFADDPQHPGTSLPLGAMNRMDDRCHNRLLAAGPSGLDSSYCNGVYASTIDNPDPVIIGTCGDSICGKNERRQTACGTATDCPSGSSCSGGLCTGGSVCAADCKGDIYSNHFYFRRPDQAMWKGAIAATADTYHMLPYGGACNL